MPIAELGYRPWDGARTGVMQRWMAITRSEIGIAFGSSKLLRRFLIFAWIPILYFCPIFLAIGYVADPANNLTEGAMLTEIAGEFLSGDALQRIRADPQSFLPGIWSIVFYFFFAYTQSVFAMVIVAIVGPPLISRDVKSKAFLVYFSKPIQPWQYLLGKLATVIFFVFCITLFPALVLYTISIALSPDVGTVQATLPILLQISMASLATALPIGMVVLLLSSLTGNRRIATFFWLAAWIFGEIAFRVLTLGGNFSRNFEPPPWAYFLSLRELTTRAASYLFQLPENMEALFTNLGPAGERLQRSMRGFASDMGDASVIEGSTDVLAATSSGFPPWVSLLAIALLSSLSGALLLRRVTKPVRI